MNFKKNSIKSLLTLAIGAFTVSTGTFALFTDSASNESNVFNSAKVEIEDVTGRAVFSSYAHLDDFAPGDMAVDTLIVENTGTINEWVGLEHIIIEDTGLFTNWEDLNVAQIHYWIEVKDKSGNPFPQPAGVNLGSETNPILADINSMEIHSPVVVPPDGKEYVHFKFSLPLEAGNSFQDKSAIAQIKVIASQYRNNENMPTVDNGGWGF